jgi:hypothetical protein
MWALPLPLSHRKKSVLLPKNRAPFNNSDECRESRFGPAQRVPPLPHAVAKGCPTAVPPNAECAVAPLCSHGGIGACPHASCRRDGPLTAVPSLDTVLARRHGGMPARQPSPGWPPRLSSSGSAVPTVLSRRRVRTTAWGHARTPAFAGMAPSTAALRQCRVPTMLFAPPCSRTTA